MSDEEISESGARILRHEMPESGFESATGDSENMALISDHIEQHIGPVATVFHEMVSDLVHIDIHIVEPTEERNFYTLVTSGMSDRPMSPPEEAKAAGLEYTELYLCLPPDWQLREEAFKDEANYWPIRMLKNFARFPHQFKTWLWEGHTVPNGNPQTPFIEGTGLSGVLVFSPLSFDQAFYTLPVGTEKVIHFHALIPIHGDEMNLKLNKGMEALLPGFDQHGVTEVLQPQRPSVVGAGIAGSGLAGQPDASAIDLLAKMPIYVFFLIAGADGDVDEKETMKFFELIAAALEAPSPMFAAAAQSLFDQGPELLSYVAQNELSSLPIHMAAMREVIETNIPEPGENMNYKYCLLAMAKQIAEASGGFLGFGRKIGKEEKQAIESLAGLLEVPGFKI